MADAQRRVPHPNEVTRQKNGTKVVHSRDRNRAPSRATNLLRQEWDEIDSSDLRLILESRAGGPGQYHGDQTEKGPLYIPLYGACKLILWFKENRVSKIERGAHFDESEWDAVSAELDALVDARADEFGRAIAFSGHRVDGSWRGARSGVQILPVPEGAPTLPQEIGQHPFVLEIPLTSDSAWTVKNRRRMREHRKTALLLNVLLRARISCETRQTRFTWATTMRTPVRNVGAAEIGAVGPGDDWHRVEWAQCSYVTDIGAIFADVPSETQTSPLMVLPVDEYYGGRGWADGGLCVPADLDESICAYQRLPRRQRERFDRALYWLDLASEYWPISMSSSFASLVSAVESLIQRGKVHTVRCRDCDKSFDHDVPSLGAKFNAFFETYAPGQGLKKQRGNMYALRSGILHGTTLISFDVDLATGWDPHWEHQNKLHRELWELTQIALRNYLRNPPAAEPSDDVAANPDGATDPPPDSRPSMVPWHRRFGKWITAPWRTTGRMIRRMH
jgi:hypothetical protein